MVSVPQPAVDYLDSYRCPHRPVYTLLAILPTAHLRSQLRFSDHPAIVWRPATLK